MLLAASDDCSYKGRVAQDSVTVAEGVHGNNFGCQAVHHNISTRGFFNLRTPLHSHTASRLVCT